MFDALPSLYPWIKSLHVISVIAWMAGLFYLPRLFVYHAEQVGQSGETHEMFTTMERRLLKAIMNPAMIASWVFGLLLVATPGIVDRGLHQIEVDRPVVGQDVERAPSMFGPVLHAVPARLDRSAPWCARRWRSTWPA